MSDDVNRPRPRPTDISESFWDATSEGRFELQRCDTCGAVIFYPRVNCPECGSRTLSAIDASGRGEVYTFTVARRPTHRAFADAGPYVIAIVELEEGPHVTTNIVDCDPDDVTVGMAVELTFDTPDEGPPLPLFRPAAAAG